MKRIYWLPLLIGVVLSAANAAGQNATANIQPAQADVFQTTVNYVGEFYPLWFIVNDYLNHTGPTNWITHTNIGIWAPNEFIQRSSITQYIQYANDHETAAYFHTFKDANGSLLDGTDPKDYVFEVFEEGDSYCQALPVTYSLRSRGH